MRRDGSVIAERRSDEGMMTAGTTGFSAVLEAHLAAAQAPAALPVVICGMAGSRQGWVEARYLDVPASLDAIVDQAVPVPDAARPVWILPGLAQRLRDRADVMRGEETQLMGAASRRTRAEADGFYCLPGTHSKWVRLEGGRVTGFSTFMTGEIFALMGEQSILKHAVTGEAMATEDPAFAQAVRQTFENPALLTGRLFSIRGSQLLFADSPAVAKARLSGFLIGAEIAGSGSAKERATVKLIASGKLRAVYEAALSSLGIAFRTIDAETCVRDGLAYAAATLFNPGEGRRSA
ncbi:MAG: 2-dehydro-3-deoxygalactonokinase [Pararhizobium sp.]